MSAENYLRVVAEGHSYRVWEKKGRVYCVEELEGGAEKKIFDWRHIPASIQTAVDEAVEKVLPRPKPVPINPWDNPNFRFGGLSSCLDCDGLAS